MKVRSILYSIVILLLLVFISAAKSSGVLPLTAKKMKSEQIKAVPYKKDGIEAEYPQLLSDGNQETLNKINLLIRSDFDKILQIYSFNPFPEPAPVPNTSVPVILKLTYNIRLNNSQYASIYYHAAYNSPYSAHPTDLVYTTGIDKKKNSRLSLRDVIHITPEFVKDFRTWDLVEEAGEDQRISQGIRDYLAGLSDEDILMGMKTADRIGSGNLLDIYSYLTPDSLGISIGVPNYLGDHAQFEKKFSELKRYLNSEFKVPE